MERSPELGQYLRESYGFGLPSQRRPGGLEAPNVRPFPKQNLGTGGVEFDAEGWPTASGGWGQRADANASIDKGRRNAGLSQVLSQIGMQPGLDPPAYRQILDGLSDQEILAMASSAGYSGLDNPQVIRTLLSIDMSILGKF